MLSQISISQKSFDWKKNNDIINQCNVYNLTICLGKLPKVFHKYFRKYLSILSIKQK